MRINKIQISKWYLIDANFQFQQNFFLLKYIQAFKFITGDKKIRQTNFRSIWVNFLMIIYIYIYMCIYIYIYIYIHIYNVYIDIALVISFPISDSRCWYILVINFAWCRLKVDKRMSSLMAVTSLSGSFARASIIQDVKYSLKACLFILCEGWRMRLLLSPTAAASESYSLEPWQILYHNLIVYPLELIGP